MSRNRQVGKSGYLGEGEEQEEQKKEEKGKYEEKDQDKQLGGEKRGDIGEQGEEEEHKY